MASEILHIRKSVPPASQQCTHKTGDADCYLQNMGSAGEAVYWKQICFLKQWQKHLSVLSQRQD